MENLNFTPDKRRRTDEQLIALNETLKATKSGITIFIREPTSGYYGKPIELNYPVHGKRKRRTILNVLKEYGIPQRDIQPRLFAEDSAMWKNINQTTINQLYTAVFELAAKLKNPTISANSKTTLFEYINTIAIENERSGKSTKLQKQLLYNLRFTKAQNIKIKDITPEYITAFLLAIEKNGLKPQTRKNIYAAFRAVLYRAQRSNIIRENPINKIEKKFIPKHERVAAQIHYLEYEELAKLAECYENEKHARTKQALQIFLFQCCTGFRIGDVVMLQWRNIDFEKNKITIVEQKTKKTMRKTLTESAKYYLPKTKGVGVGFVFPEFASESGKVYINRLLKKYDSVIGKHIHTHAARHTFATLHYERNKDIEALKHEMNHYKIQTTEIYAQIADLTRENEMKNLDKFVVAILDKILDKYPK